MRTKHLEMLILSAVLLLILGLFTACGGEDGNDSSTDGDDSSADGDDKGTDGDTIDNDTTDDDTTDSDTTDGDTTDGDTTDGDAMDGDVDDEAGDTGLTWIAIAGGTFQMGCVPQDDDCYSDESPRHSVTVPAFQITQTEVTQAQYEEVTGNNPSHFSDCGGNCPVENVNWYDAKAFCEAAGGRLPSEAEWEYAARAGTETIWFCGDDPGCVGDIVCWDKEGTCPVGQYDPNDFGLYDMPGGVWEWVGDCYHENYEAAPTDGGVWEDEQCFSKRVLRGGSWYVNDVRYLRASARYYNDPDGSNSTYGFRCARD